MSVNFLRKVCAGVAAFALATGIASASPDKPVIGVVVKIGGIPWFNAMDAGIRKRAEQLGARVVNLGHLSDATMQKIDARSTSFWAAVNHTEGNLGLLERQRVKVWLNRAYEQMDSVGP